MKRPRLLLLTPPLLQPNSPYPATMHLTGFLAARGCDVHQCDLSIKVVRDILIAYGGDEAEELLELLASAAPPEAKRAASVWMEDLARRIHEDIDDQFGFARYAEAECRAVADFGILEKLVRRRSVLDKPLAHHLTHLVETVKPTIVGVTCPFPGTLVGAFKIARFMRKHYPHVKLWLGGGYVNTELREMTDRRPFRYFDEILFDEGYGPIAKRLLGCDVDVPAFVCPSYRGIDWNDYFDVVESDNYVTSLWSVGRWIKLTLARGCYWHKCAFCDVVLPYIGCFRQPDATVVVDALERLAAEAPAAQFHFVDEAMPPALVRGICNEILRRKFRCTWWGNIRFDAAFTPALAKKMAKAGCIAVTGGLECANDRLLALMNKGISCASAEKVLAAFKAADVYVHAYLMYDFPTETPREQRGAERYVRGLVRRGLIQSYFWHRFALTVHSPIYRNGVRFGVEVQPPPKHKRVFARNEVAYSKLS